MNKYELAVVVSAKIEDEERAAVVDKCKALIERFGGTITNVDDWGKKRLAYEIQKMKEGFCSVIMQGRGVPAKAAITSSSSRLNLLHLQRSKAVFASWTTY